MAKCPMCQSRVKRGDITCAICGFALPSDGAPILGPPPEASGASYDFGTSSTGARFSSAKVEFPTPVRRDYGELLGILVAVIWTLGAYEGGEPVIFFLGLLFGLSAIGPTLYAVLGRERALVYTDRLVVARTVLGVTLRKLVVPVAEMKNVRFVGGESGTRKRTTFWRFSRGTIRIETTHGNYEFGEGFAPDSAVAKELAARIKRELAFPPYQGAPGQS